MMKFEFINSPKNLLTGFIRDESGQDLIEYALVAAIIALGATTAMTSVATAPRLAVSSNLYVQRP